MANFRVLHKRETHQKARRRSVRFVTRVSSAKSDTSSREPCPVWKEANHRFFGGSFVFKWSACEARTPWCRYRRGGRDTLKLVNITEVKNLEADVMSSECCGTVNICELRNVDVVAHVERNETERAIGKSVLQGSCRLERRGRCGVQVIMPSGIVGQVASRWLLTRCPRECSELRG